MRWTLVGLALLTACDGGTAEEKTDPGTTTAAAPVSTSSSSQTAPSTSERGASSGGGPAYAPPLATCRRECEFAADCCPAGLDACPSPGYPGNYGCEDGMCVPPTCLGDAECDALTPGAVCKPLHGVFQCIVVCDGEAPCEALGGGFGCGGATDEGQSYCYERCDLGPPCPLDTCNPDGVCVCASTDECVSNYRCDIDE